MARPSVSEAKRQTISYRVTDRCYNRVIDRVEKSQDADLSEYARKALEDRMNKEEEAERTAKT